MMNNLKKGSILSELQFYVVQEVTNDLVTVSDENGTIIEIGKEYVEKILNSADNFTEEKKVNQTELAEIFQSNTRIVMTVCFKKKDELKTAKALKKEKDERKNKILSANVHDLPNLIDDLINNPIQEVIPGEERVMKGRHYGLVDLGRIKFIDMEVIKDNNSSFDNRMRLVDSRTIQYVIVGGIKYSLKH